MRYVYYPYPWLIGLTTLLLRLAIQLTINPTVTIKFDIIIMTISTIISIVLLHVFPMYKWLNKGYSKRLRTPPELWRVLPKSPEKPQLELKVSK